MAKYTKDVTAQQCWLMKAEPDTRMVKGKDVAFSVDHFEAMGTSHWDGVRNALAKKYMKEGMKLGDKVLFYHSNTKVPGVAAFAEVVKEGYPDHTAWDPEHPYYDAKSKQDAPTWYMVDVAFRERAAHLVPLALYKALAERSQLPAEVSYLNQEHLEAIKAMPLINKGRLSVQPVSSLAYEATVLLAKNGGFDELVQKPKKQGKKASTAAGTTDGPDAAPTNAPQGEDSEQGQKTNGASVPATAKRKKRVKPESDTKDDPDAAVAPRRSKRKTA